ncbi:MAG: hypothetical protein ACYCO0_03200 [Candidatus Micrarchaeaceae archaeon]
MSNKEHTAKHGVSMNIGELTNDGHKWELRVPKIFFGFYGEFESIIHDIDLPFWAGLVQIVFWAFLIALAGLFLYSFFIFWQIPVALIVIWLLYEAIRNFGISLKNRKQ